MEKVDKKHKEEIMKRIREAGDPDNYEVAWDEKGIPKSKKKVNVKRGGLSRAQGARFELKVRKDLEDKGRVVDKWSNNVDLPSKDDSSESDEGKVVIAKRKYNPFKKMLVVGTGFPDFISIKYVHSDLYSVIGVEVKMNGILSKIEKEKCAFYLRKKIFSQIWIAKKGAPKDVPRDIPKEKSTRGKKRGQIEYDDFQEKYGKKYNKT
jgi:hypothetical protein